jgi:Asp-tRNA(Asn)/Glu-tRNA(Gln) amidotransferase C subunit
MKLDIKAIEHLAVLAKLSLATGEAEIYGRQLTDILGHLDHLDEASDFIEKQQLVDQLNDCPTTTMAVDLSVDEVIAWPKSEVADSLAMADSQLGQEIIMPRIK